MDNTSPPEPAVYSGNHEVSPSKRNAWKSADPKKRQKSLPHDAELDRQLAVWDSMDSSLLTTLQEFEDNILWPVDSAGDIPRPSLNAVDTMRKVVRRLFFTEDGEERREVSEDVIARTIVRLSLYLSSSTLTRENHR